MRDVLCCHGATVFAAATVRLQWHGDSGSSGGAGVPFTVFFRS